MGLESSDPKTLKMGNPAKKKDEKPSLEEGAEAPNMTFDDLKKFLSEKFEAQDQKLNSTIEQQSTNLKKLTEPILQKQMATTLSQIQAKQTETQPDPHIQKQRTDLLTALRQENLILTVQNAPEELEGTDGWKTLLAQLKIRNNRKASEYQNASIRTTFLSGNRKSTAITFKSKSER